MVGVAHHLRRIRCGPLRTESVPVLFTLGIALGMGRLLTGRIGASIITHALINGLGMIALLATV